MYQLALLAFKGMKLSSFKNIGIMIIVAALIATIVYGFFSIKSYVKHTQELELLTVSQANDIRDLRASIDNMKKQMDLYTKSQEITNKIDTVTEVKIRQVNVGNATRKEKAIIAVKIIEQDNKVSSEEKQVSVSQIYYEALMQARACTESENYCIESKGM